MPETPDASFLDATRDPRPATRDPRPARDSYDALAAAYTGDRELDLDGKPLDRALYARLR